MQDAATRGNEQSKGPDKNAYLYDRMVAGDKGNATQQAQKAPETKNEQPKAQVQNADTGGAIKQGTEEMRIPLQVDMTLSQENEMRRSVNDQMSAEAVKAIYALQAEAMREQLSIASAELGLDAPVEIIGKQEAEQPGVAPYRK